MHQNHAVCLLAGLVHHIAVDGVRTGVTAHSVLGADIPVHPLPALLLHFGLQLFHQLSAAVAAAHRVGAAAGEPQIPDAFCIHIGGNALLQQCNVRPVGFAAVIDVAVLVGGGMQRDLMPGSGSLCEQGQILLVVAGSHHKKGAMDPGGIQCCQHRRSRPAGPVIKGQADPFFGLRTAGVVRKGGSSGTECRSVRHGGQVLLGAAGKPGGCPGSKPGNKGKQGECGHPHPLAQRMVF